MFSRANLIQRYEELRDSAEALKSEVDGVLLAYSQRTKYLYQSRLKDRDSFLQKLETGRFDTTDVPDLFACTLVVPTLPQVRECIDGLPAAITVRSERGPTTREKEPQVFRFDEWQLLCELQPPPGSTNIPSPFELQVKTVTLYAWGEATHDLVYKGDEFDWRRERLSAQLRAVAEQADLLYSEFLDVAARVPVSRSTATDELSAVATALKSWMSDGIVPTTHCPTSPVRYAESVVRAASSMRLEVAPLLAEVRAWLETNGYPVSLSLYQVVLGVASTHAVDWNTVDSSFRCLVTTELVDLFPTTAAIPPDRSVEMPTS